MIETARRSIQQYALFTTSLLFHCHSTTSQSNSLSFYVECNFSTTQWRPQRDVPKEAQTLLGTSGLDQITSSTGKVKTERPRGILHDCPAFGNVTSRRSKKCHKCICRPETLEWSHIKQLKRLCMLAGRAVVDATKKNRLSAFPPLKCFL